MRNLLVPALLVAAACGGGGGGGGSPTAAPVASAPEAVLAFMRAAKDSSLTRMGQLWAANPSSTASYEKRLAVIQAYLHGDSTRVVSDVAVSGDVNRRQLSAALYRGTCVKQIPFTTVRSKNGWLIESVDIAAAGNPARPCEPGPGPRP